MSFQEEIISAYTFKGESALLGCAMFDKKAIEGTQIKIPLKTMNRHGLIAGATGTGKTKTLQVIAECLSDNSVPVLMMDIKGDLSGIGASGTSNEKILERCKLIGIEYKPASYPLEFLTLSNEPGTKLRATISEFGPILLSKVLELNDTQEGIVSMIFKYCDDNKLPLLDLKDFIRVLQYITNEGKDELKAEYGNVSAQSTGTILRKVIGLQQQGADNFFGEKSFEVDDLMRMSDDGRGLISILRVTDLQDRPKLFSTFMLQLLAELYGSLPEEGDLDKPKLVLFIDEAHLIFQDATSALLQQLETIIKLIRSKGVGLFFITQSPSDIPASILGQLGFKVQHALRAFTAKDRTDIKKTSENFPETTFYKTEDLITEMGIGEAFVTLLNEKGIPTPLVHTLLRAPNSRMDVLSPDEINSIVSQSKIAAKYNQVIDSQSAYELLNEKLKEASGDKEEEEKTSSSQKEEKSTLESILDNPTARQVGRTAASILTRTLLGALGLGGTSTRRRKKTSWF
ncbi:MAG: DUF853 family protein [Chitinophagaceae bacterium]|nr:DUF853 family protein [Chitinophagaceae bacterium]